MRGKVTHILLLPWLNRSLSIEIDILQWSNKIIRSCGFVWVGIFEFWMERQVYLSNSEYTLKTLKTFLNNIFKFKSRWDKIQNSQIFWILFMKLWHCFNSQCLFNLKFEIFDFNKCFWTNKTTNKWRTKVIVFSSLWFWVLCPPLWWCDGW